MLNIFQQTSHYLAKDLKLLATPTLICYYLSITMSPNRSLKEFFSFLAQFLGFYFKKVKGSLNVIGYNKKL